MRSPPSCRWSARGAPCPQWMATSSRFRTSIDPLCSFCVTSANQRLRSWAGRLTAQGVSAAASPSWFAAAVAEGSVLHRRPDIIVPAANERKRPMGGPAQRATAAGLRDDGPQLGCVLGSAHSARRGLSGVQISQSRVAQRRTVSSSEHVASGADLGAGLVVALVGVAASRARGSVFARWFVGRHVAIRARGVPRRRVERGQRGRSVAGLASGRSGDTTRAVRAMTGRAATLDRRVRARRSCSHGTWRTWASASRRGARGSPRSAGGRRARISVRLRGRCRKRPVEQSHARPMRRGTTCSRRDRGSTRPAWSHARGSFGTRSSRRVPRSRGACDIPRRRRLRRAHSCRRRPPSRGNWCM